MDLSVPEDRVGQIERVLISTIKQRWGRCSVRLFRTEQGLSADVRVGGAQGLIALPNLVFAPDNIAWMRAALEAIETVVPEQLRDDVEVAEAWRHLVAQQPKKLESLSVQEQIDRLAKGLCPGCRRPTAGWEVPLGSFAPEAFATLRDHSIDPSTGHRVGCKYGRS